MKNYKLFSEFCDAELWGIDPIEAITTAGELQRPGVPVPAEIGGQLRGWAIERPAPLVVAKVLGTVDTTNMRRGSSPIIRLLIEDNNGKRHEVDMRETGATLAPA